jgi:hypothetical protein
MGFPLSCRIDGIHLKDVPARPIPTLFLKNGELVFAKGARGEVAHGRWSCSSYEQRSSRCSAELATAVLRGV